MVIEFIVYGICLAALTLGSYTDLKTREVPDWVNYGLMISGIGLNLLFSLTSNNWSYIINSVIGLVIMVVFGHIMFYTGQWGGGDSKMLMGLGAMLGFDIKLRSPFLIDFFVNMLLFGALYGLGWSLCLAIKNRNGFIREARNMAIKKDFVKYRRYMLLVVLILAGTNFFFTEPLLKLTALGSALSIMVIFYLIVFVKIVEKACMLKLVDPNQLTEGDWIARNIIVQGKYITGPKDLGIEKKSIRKLIELYKKKKVNKILIKQGVPFVPSFLMAFIATLVYGNLILLFV